MIACRSIYIITNIAGLFVCETFSFSTAEVLRSCGFCVRIATVVLQGRAQ
jgi:hypothetical protein